MVSILTEIPERDHHRIADMAAFSYSPEKMCDVLLLDGEFRRAFIAQYHDECSALFELCEKGRARFDYMIDKKLMTLATSGDLKALAELEKRKRRNK